LANGEEIVVDSQGYGRARNSENRDDRKLAFDAFWKKWAEYRSSVGMVMNSHLQTQVALAKARNYDSVLERELFQDNLPPAVYRTLVSDIASLLQATRPHAWR
jgi:oligoendopeptidase F